MKSSYHFIIFGFGYEIMNIMLGIFISVIILKQTMNYIFEACGVKNYSKDLNFNMSLRRVHPLNIFFKNFP